MAWYGVFGWVGGGGCGLAAVVIGCGFEEVACALKVFA